MTSNNQIDGLSNLVFAMSDAVSADPDSAKDFLIEEGFDPDNIVEAGLLKINKFQTRQRLKLAKENKTLLESAREKFEELVGNYKNVDNPVSHVLGLFSGHNQEDMIAFGRSIKNLKDEDALKFLTKAKLLEIIQEMENLKDEQA